MRAFVAGSVQVLKTVADAPRVQLRSPLFIVVHALGAPLEHLSVCAPGSHSRSWAGLEFAGALWDRQLCSIRGWMDDASLAPPLPSSHTEEEILQIARSGGEPCFRPHFLVWIIGWRHEVRRSLAFEYVNCNFCRTIRKLRKPVGPLTRPSLPQLHGSHSRYQLSIICCIRVTTLYNGLLGPPDGRILTTLSRFGLAVWWRFFEWVCSHQKNG